MRYVRAPKVRTAQARFLPRVFSQLFRRLRKLQSRCKFQTNQTDVLNRLSGTLEAISQRSGQAVVQIYAKSYVTSDSSSGSDSLLTAQESTGSGVILSADGFILTDDHVVRGATQVRVKLAMRRRDETREHCKRNCGGR